MEPFLIKMGDKIDQTTKYMLQSLINKKIKYHRYKNIHFLLFTASLFFGVSFFLILYKFNIVPYHYSILDSISFILKNKAFVALIVIAIILFGSVKINYEKMEKYEKEFHDLRCEIIENSGELWPENSWNDRHVVFEWIKEVYDINLYHKSK